MFQLKPLSKEAIPGALEKAERYRVLNEPLQAESICLDVLEADPGDQRALVMLLLALTDQLLENELVVRRATEIVPRLESEYERAYYTGIIFERRAKARFDRGDPGARFAAYEWFREAMAWYEKAEAIRPPRNDDALLRWNTCARILMRNPQLHAAPPDRGEQPLE